MLHARCIRCDSCKLDAKAVRCCCLRLLQILMLIEGALQTKKNRTKICRRVSSRMPVAAHQLLPSSKNRKTSCQVSNVTLVLTHYSFTSGLLQHLCQYAHITVILPSHVLLSQPSMVLPEFVWHSSTRLCKVSMACDTDR